MFRDRDIGESECNKFQPPPAIMLGTQPQIMSTIWTKYAASASLGSDEKRSTRTKEENNYISSWALIPESLTVQLQNCVIVELA